MIDRRNGVRWAAAAAVLGLAGGTDAGIRVVASFPAADIDVPSAGATVILPVSGLSELVSGFGITGRWTGVVRDNGGGVAPWSLDFGVDVSTPAGVTRSSPSPWFGDFTIADYPVADAFDGFGGIDPNGDWTISLDSGNAAPWVAGLRDVAYHLLAESGPDLEFEYTDTTQQGNAWSRPFFIEGVSGLGPVDYQVLEFKVSVSGLYSFESVLASGGDHWTCLYKGDFVSFLPLVNLHEYNLGNGFSPFDTPRGTSRFDQLLFAGTTYHWVTSQWSAFAAFSEFTNTISGPGAVLVAGQGCNDADNAEPFGVLDLADVQGFIGAFVNQQPAADIAAPAGVWDLADVQAFVGAFTSGCP
jgi:hypothetical protein